MKRKLLLFITLLFNFSVFSQTTFYSRNNGNWNNVNTWSTVACGGAAATAFPLAGDDVIICSGNNISVNVNSDCNNLTIQGTGTLDFPTNNITLNANGNVSISGTGGITALAGGGSATRVLNVAGTFNVASAANIVIGGLTLNVTGIVTTDGTITCTNNTGTKNFLSDFNINSTGDLLFSQGETYTISGNLNMVNGSSIGGGATGTIIVNGMFNVLNGVGSVLIGRASMTINSSTNIDGTLLFATSASGNKSFRDINISATGVWNNTVGEDPRINGNIVNNGNWIGNIGGTADYQFGRTIAGNYTISGNPVVFSRLSIQNGTTVTNLGTVIINGNVNPGVRNRGGGMSTFNNGDGVSTAVLYIENTGGTTGIDLNSNGITFNASFINNTVYYSSGGNQNIRIPDDLCYYNLVLSTAGTKSLLAGTTSIRNSVTIKDNAILNVGNNTLTDGCGGSAGLTMTDNSQLLISKCSPTAVPQLSGVYSLTGGTVVLNGGCNQIWNSAPIGSNTVNNITLSGSGTKCLNGITDITGDLTLSGSATITCAGNITMDCSKNFNYNSTGTTTLTNNISVGNISLTSGTLNDGGNIITVCGSSWDNSGGTFTATGRVVFNGNTTITGTTITTFNNITINATKFLTSHATNINIKGTDFTNDGTFLHNNGTVTFTTATVKTILGASQTTFNNLQISAGTLKGHSVNMNVEGNFTNNSTFTHNNGKVTFINGNAQQIAGASNSTFFDLEINKTPSTVITQSVATVSVTNLFTMTEGIYNAQTNTLNGAGNFNATGGDLQLARIATVPQLTGTYNITGGTVTLNGAGVQTLKTGPPGPGGSDTYYNLVFATSGAKNIGGLLFINGDVTVTGSSTLTTNSAFTQASTKLFNYFSTGNTTMAATTNFTVGSFVMTAGTFNINGNNMTITGDNWNKSGGTFTTSGRVIFAGNNIQNFTHDANNFANITVNNTNGVSLNNNISITTNLTFTLGNIITNANYAILTANGTTVTGASQITGFVDGNLQKYISTSPKTFEIGSNGNYSPLNFVFASITSAGNLICSTTAGEHPDVFAADIDLNKNVNRYWTIDFNTLAVTTFNTTFNYQSSEVDAVADPTNFSAQRYDGALWSNLTISGTPNYTQTVVNNSTPTTSNDYVIGERYNPYGVYNAVTGIMNWNNPLNWIKYRTGTITSVLGNNVITGGGTSFTTEVNIGDIILLQSNPGTPIGTVLSVDNDNQITLTGGASANSTNASFGINALPSALDEVNIGNPFIAGAAVNVNLDIASVTILKLTFTRMAFSNSLTHLANNVLNISNNVYMKQPTNANANLWDINNGQANISGNLSFGSADAGAGRISKVNVINGIITISTNINYNSTIAANCLLDISGGTSTMNIGGNFNLTNTGTRFGTFIPGANSIVNYNRSAGIQTINFTTIAPAVTYANLYLNNTSASGVRTLNSITTTNVTGNIRVQSGKFYYSGLSATGNAAKTFEVANGATFQMLGNANFPTGFGTFVFGPTSTTQFHQSTAKNITVVPAPGYGNLQIQPSGNVTHAFVAGTTNIQGNLDLGNGVNIATVNTSNLNVLVNLLGNLTINPNTTYNHANSSAVPALLIGGNWVNNGTFVPGTRTITFNGTTPQFIDGTVVNQTFSNIIVAKSAGVLLSCAPGVTTINTNNITINSGDFNLPATTNINATATASVTLNAGTLTAGSIITIRGNWTNNGGGFIPNNGLVQFVQGSNPQNINGTAVTQDFYDLEINKTGGSVVATGSTKTLNINNNFTQTAFGLNASSLNSLNVGNAFTITSGTFTPCNDINIGGNLNYNGGTLTWGTNVAFNGSNSQTVNGAVNIPNFNNLTINNTFPSTAVVLNKPITVNGTFTLSDGHLVTTVANILTLGSTAVVSTPAARPAQDSTFVKGPMINTIATVAPIVKNFPVGAGNVSHYANLSVTQSAATSTQYTGEFTNSSAASFGWSIPASLVRVSGIGYWTINKGAGASVASASVDLFYLDSFDDVNDPANLKVAKGDPNSWLDIGGKNQLDGFGMPTGYVTSSVNFTTFSKFSLANGLGGTNPLPINLMSFTANCNSNNVLLKWVTASETNNKFFTIEKSFDAMEYNPITYVDGAGTTNSTTLYSVTDENAVKNNQIIYYRLKQTDFDDKFTLSEPVSIQCEKDNIEDFRVGTSENEIIVYFNGTEGTNYNISIYDNIGRVVSNNVLNLVSSNAEFPISISNIPRGTYNLIVSSDNYLKTKQIILLK